MARYLSTLFSQTFTASCFPSRIRQRMLGAPWVWLICFVIVWTATNAIANSATAINLDMSEAYAWGRDFEWGYYKHPPFWAWIARLWFAVAPHTIWSFALLAAINSAIGIWGAWCLIGLFATGDKRDAAAILLVVSPFYTFFAYKYNASTIFLSLWPWCAYFFIRSLREERLSLAVGFGLVSGLCILSKYYAIVFLITCLFAALVRPDRKRYFSSPRPYLAIGICAAVTSPHLWWLVTTGFRPVSYFSNETGHGTLFAVGQALNQLFQYGAAQLGILAIVWFGGGLRNTKIWWTHTADPNSQTLFILALGPFALTVVFSLIFRTVLSTNTAISVFCLLPLLLIDGLDATKVVRVRRWALRMAGTFSGVALIASPILAYAHASRVIRGTPTIDQPCEEISDLATSIWRQEMQTPLRIVAGRQICADAITFYSSDKPSEFIDFDTRKSPWITPQRLRRDGMLAICDWTDTSCVLKAYGAASHGVMLRTVTAQRQAWGRIGLAQRFILILSAPANES